MPWGLIVICVVAFGLLQLTTVKGKGICPGGCHGCGQCMVTKAAAENRKKREALLSEKQDKT
jgi:hypothetical protein